MKIKKGLFTVIVFTLVTVNSFAQFTKCKVADIEKLKQEGTVVVAISDDEATNKAAEEIMKSSWTASKYKIIKRLELDEYVKTNPQNYVLTYLMGNSTSTFTMTSTTASAGTVTNNTTSHTARAVGDGMIIAKNVKKPSKLKPTDAMFFCYFDAQMDRVSMRAEFIRQIGAINSVCVYPGLTDKQVGGWKIATLDTKEITSKELWITAEDVKKGADEAKMKAAYNPYKYKIVTKEEIATAIVEKRKGIVYASRGDYDPNGALYIYLIHSPDDNRVLFFMGGQFDHKDFTNIKNNKQYGQ